jgi:hypothetical protein
VLAADLKPVDPRRILRAVILALAISTAAAFGVMLLIFGLRPEMPGARNPDFLVIKLLFAFAVVVTGAIFLPQLTRPGAEMRNSRALVSTPYAAIAAVATAALGSVHFSTWPDMIAGKDRLTCLLSIPLLVVLPFTVLIWALSDGAPTDRTRAGELVSGVRTFSETCSDGA